MHVHKTVWLTSCLQTIVGNSPGLQQTATTTKGQLGDAGRGGFLSWHMHVAGQETVQSKGLIECFGSKSGRAREQKLRRITHWFEQRTCEPQPDLDSKPSESKCVFLAWRLATTCNPALRATVAVRMSAPQDVVGVCRPMRKDRTADWVWSCRCLVSFPLQSCLSTLAACDQECIWVFCARVCVCARLFVSTPYASKPRSAFIFKPYRWTDAGGDAGDSLEPH